MERVGRREGEMECRRAKEKMIRERRKMDVDGIRGEREKEPGREVL